MNENVINKSLDILKDSRVDCLSVLQTMKASDYLEMVRKAYENRGGIEGQRDPLKTNTAIRIRKTMISDLAKGAILPPLVLGIVIDEDNHRKISSLSEIDFQDMIAKLPREIIFIIDGMQRTTALLELSKSQNINDYKLRVEYWIASKINSLIYRMLVLNTGQVPWNLRRQVEIVFQSMIKEIKHRVPAIELLEVNSPRRRVAAGQLQASEVIELFLVFGARKEKVDTKERLAEEFTRLDFIEATSEQKFTEMFYDVLYYLVAFDKAIEKFIPPLAMSGEEDQSTQPRFLNGKDLFSAQPACVGFVTAFALEVFGRPGSSERTPEEQQKKFITIKQSLDDFLERINLLGPDQIGDFLDFTTLSQLLSNVKTPKVGDFEREFFLKAFQVLIGDNFKTKIMTPCWRAY